MEKYIKATALLPDFVIEELKKKTGEKTNKEALAKAIYHYVGCIEIKKEVRDRKKEITISE